MKVSEQFPTSLQEVFQKDGRIILVYLFGSRAKGNFSEQSDLDLALLTSKPFSLEEQAEFNATLMKILHRDRVDSIFFAEAPILLKFEIVNEGKVIYSRLDQDKINDFELAIFREYYHTERFRDLQLKNLEEAFSR